MKHSHQSFMYMNKSQSYIYPIFSREEVGSAGLSKDVIADIRSVIDTICGNGFFVGDYFVTAAHVISAVNYPFIKMNGQEITLKQTDAIVWRIMSEDPKEEEYRNTNNADVAIFHVPNVGSPLQFSEKLPEPSTILSCNYHCHSKFCESQGVVGDKDFFLGNFFGCQMSPIHPTEGGSSGSPLIKDDIVYGILHAGDTSDTSICVFSSAAYALHLLRQHIGRNLTTVQNLTPLLNE